MLAKEASEKMIRGRDFATARLEKGARGVDPIEGYLLESLTPKRMGLMRAAGEEMCSSNQGMLGF